MAVVQGYPKGRDFTAEELIGRQIRIEGPVPKKGKVPLGLFMLVIADDEMVGNVSKVVLNIEPCSIVEATLTLHVGETTQEVTLRDNIELSFSAIVSEVQ